MTQHVKLFSIVLVVVCSVCSAKQLSAQESDQKKTNADKIAALEAKLTLAEKEIELLTTENELLKKELALSKKKKSVSDEDPGKVTLSDSLAAGASITGSWRSLNKPKNDGEFGSGTITITLTERDGGKFKGDCVISSRDGTSSNCTVTGAIRGQRLTWETVGNATLIKASLVRKNDEALEGSYQIPATGDGGTVAFTFSSLDPVQTE